MRRLGLLLLVSSFALAGAAIPAAAGSSPLSDVTVTGAVGTEPTVKFSKPLSTANTVHRDIVAGTGKKLATGDKVTFKYLALDGRTAKQVESSFDKAPASLVLDKKRSVAGLVKSLVGAKVGSRVLIALAPKEGVARGLQSSGVKKNDTLVFVVDVTDVRAPLKRATGTPVPPVDRAAHGEARQERQAGDQGAVGAGAHHAHRAAARQGHRAGGDGRADDHGPLHGRDLGQRQAVRLLLGPRQAPSTSRSAKGR